MTKRSGKRTTSTQRKPVRQAASQPKRLHERVFESDGTYFLKLVLVFLLATFWVKFGTPFSLGGLVFTAVPVGLLIGILLVRIFEKHQADRKIWYALLIVVTVITFYDPSGIVI